MFFCVTKVFLFPHVSVVGSSWNVKISLAHWFFIASPPLRSILSVATAAAAIDCDGCLNAEPVIIDDCRLPADQSGPAGGGFVAETTTNTTV